MKINTVDTVIQDFREGQNIFRRPSVELMVREISRLQTRVQEFEVFNNILHTQCINALDLHRESDIPKLKDIPKIIENFRTRVQELEQERRWIPLTYRNPHSNGLYDVWITGVHNSISAIYQNGKWNMLGVTHWRCKPKSPSEEE